VSVTDAIVIHVLALVDILVPTVKHLQMLVLMLLALMVEHVSVMDVTAIHVLALVDTLEPIARLLQVLVQTLLA
jgi:hypothetical protein